MKELLAIGAGGAIGSMLRYLAASGMAALYGKDFPYGTLTVNVIGSFLMGFLAILILDRLPNYSPVLAGFVLVGLLGGFTTFSTFSMDTFRLAFDGHVAAAGLNVLANVALCLFGTYLGYLIAMRVFSA